MKATLSMTKKVFILIALAGTIAILARVSPVPSSAAAPPMTFTVTTANDLGAGSLREALMLADANPGLDTIAFNIPGAAPHTITLATPLQPILDAVMIDGTTQPGFAGSPIIEINGNGVAVDGLTINAGPTTVRGLVINRFVERGIFVRVGNGTTIQGNFIGTDVTGTAPQPNGVNGIEISPLSPNTTVGGTGIGAGNVIAFNGANGVAIQDDSAGNLIRGNSIFSNGLLGIDLGADGVTPNDPGDPDTGANVRQNFPVLTSAGSSAGMTTITGALNSTLDTLFTLEFFVSPACDASGFGEGQTPIGTAMVMTNAAGDAPINVTLPVTVPPGQVITATATNPTNSTSEFSQCIIVLACTITCPPGLTLSTPPGTSSGCGVAASYPLPIPSGTCGIITCIPPTGSFVPVGTTVVTCTASAGPSCSFLLTVLDKTAPALTCPENIVTVLPPGSQTVIVKYPIPFASDNCGGVGASNCVPPPGSLFGVGVTPVTCTATDLSGNTSACTFRVTVGDIEPPAITCPANMSVQLPQGQCSSPASYPAPIVSDNFPGATVVCVPPSTSIFSVGVTTVTCTATDVNGNRASCAFTITLIGAGQVKLTPEGQQPTLDFDAISASKKPRNSPPSKVFTVANTGCAGTRLTLSFESLLRTGADVDSGKIKNPDDRGLFSITAINVNGSETPVSVGSATERFIIDSGQQRSFRVLFNPVIPNFAGKATDLDATEVIPNTIRSRLVMPNTAGNPLTLNLVGRITTEVRLTNFKNARKQKRADFEQSGDEFTITYAVFDSNLDVDHATYEFLDSRNQIVGQQFDVDLVGPIRDSKIIVGQSFLAVQKFLGALNNPAIASVRITVFDKESKDSITAPLVVVSKNSTNRAQSSRSSGATVVLRPMRIRGAKP